MKKSTCILFLVVAAFLAMVVVTSCSYAKANQKVVTSDDCGKTWKEVKAGDHIPRAGMNPCYMKVVMPNYPMQGESHFVVNFKNKVRVAFRVEYDYSIVDPLLFIQQAKYLGKANTDADSDDALNPIVFEGAENSVIDVRIRDVAKAQVESEDLVDADISNMEDKLFAKSNEVLKDKGVSLNFITLTMDLDDQTRQAIDVATAMRIYEAAGLGEIGKEIVKARAGANKITVGIPETKKEE